MVLINPQSSPSPLLARQRISAAPDGELVRLNFGNVEIKMGYEDALQFAAWVRVSAKQAKRAAGDQSRTWRAVAMLEGVPS